jgi:RNA polymerase sigma-70 factor, ECF subfamily
VSDAPAPRPRRTDPQDAPRHLRIRGGLRDVSDVGPSRTRRTTARAEADDAELMAGIAAGDVYALERLYDRYSALVFSVSLRVLRDTQLAEDVVQEVFLRLWRQPTSFDPERGRFVSWLMSVTRNRSLDEQRRLSRRSRSESHDEDAVRDLPGLDRFDDPQLGLEIGEQRAAVRAAMTRLPPAQREVIELAYFSGLTQVEIAERTGDPLGTVKTRIRLGMRKMREAVAEYLDIERRRPGGR